MTHTRVPKQFVDKLDKYLKIGNNREIFNQIKLIFCNPDFIEKIKTSIEEKDILEIVTKGISSFKTLEQNEKDESKQPLKYVKNNDCFLSCISNKIEDIEKANTRDFLNIIINYNNPSSFPNRLYVTCETIPKNSCFILEGIESVLFLSKNIEWLIELIKKAWEIKDLFGISVFIRNNDLDLINICDELEILSVFTGHKKMVRFNRINQARARDKGYSEILRIALIEKRLSIDEAVEFTYWHISKYDKNWKEEDLKEFSRTFLSNIKEKFEVDNLNGKPIMENLDILVSKMSEIDLV